jgi:hypothetical protein
MNTEFVKQTMRDNLGRTLIPHVADGLWSIYDNALKACQRNGQPEKTLQTFQNLLTRIPHWNEETLTKEVERIETASKCDYIEDLVLGVFVSYIRAFASLQQSEATHVEVPFERPPLPKFIQAFYTSSARKCWSSAYLFKTIGASSEQQARNRREIETLLETALSEVIDSFIPWRDISKAYFQARETAAEPEPEARPDTPAPKAPVTFGVAEVQEFEEEDEEEDEDADSEAEDRPRLQVGEDISLEDDEIEGDAASVDTETELEQKASGTVALNL